MYIHVYFFHDSEAIDLNANPKVLHKCIHKEWRRKVLLVSFLIEYSRFSFCRHWCLRGKKKSRMLDRISHSIFSQRPHHRYAIPSSISSLVLYKLHKIASNHCLVIFSCTSVTQQSIELLTINMFIFLITIFLCFLFYLEYFFILVRKRGV